MIQEELPSGARQVQGAAVKPGQIRRLGHPHRHARKVGFDGVRQPIAVRAQLSENLVQPVLSVVSGRDGGIDTRHAW